MRKLAATRLISFKESETYLAQHFDKMGKSNYIKRLILRDIEGTPAGDEVVDRAVDKLVAMLSRGQISLPIAVNGAEIPIGAEVKDTDMDEIARIFGMGGAPSVS